MFTQCSSLNDVNEKRLVMRIKLFHHDYQSEMHSSLSGSRNKKHDRALGDVEIGRMSVSLLDVAMENEDEDLIVLKKKMFKGYKIKEASLDCVIHLGALRCYEQFGSKYIE